MFIETKQEKGKLSTLQKYRKDELEKQGFAVHVWTAYNENFQEQKVIGSLDYLELKKPQTDIFIQSFGLIPKNLKLLQM